MLPKPACVSLLVALLVLPVACADDSSSPDADRPTSSTSSDPASPSVSPTSPTSGASEPSDDSAALPFPEVSPATGVVLKQPSLELRAPEGWTKSNGIVTFSSGAFFKATASMQLTEQSAFGGDSLGALSLDEQAASLLKNARRSGGPWERLPDLVIGDVTMVRVQGTNRRGHTELKVSVERSFRDDLKLLDLSIEASPAYLETNPGLFESVLNTWTWH